MVRRYNAPFILTGIFLDGFALPASIQLVFPSRIRCGRTNPLYSIDGILHSGRLRMVKIGRLF